MTVAAPGKNDDSFVLDMATSTVAFGKVIKMSLYKYYLSFKYFEKIKQIKVELSSRKAQDIPNTWGADKDGIVRILRFNFWFSPKKYLQIFKKGYNEPIGHNE